uniref:Uncharacterized protein n=1 Tax=viral metagenome TaxID=1070528 RepID=A0A6C0E1Z0_9ZZZZ
MIEFDVFFKTKNSSPKVSFNQYVEVFTTYSAYEYDRSPIDSVLYKKCLKRIPEWQWMNIFITLNDFKSNTMPVHKDSLNNTLLHRTQ